LKYKKGERWRDDQKRDMIRRQEGGNVGCRTGKDERRLEDMKTGYGYRREKTKARRLKDRQEEKVVGGQEKV
jgi:hypothetical protein